MCLVSWHRVHQFVGMWLWLVCQSHVCQSFLPITTSFFNSKLDRDGSVQIPNQVPWTKMRQKDECPPLTSKLSSGRFFAVAGPRPDYHPKREQQGLSCRQFGFP